jgi:thioredoxin 1
MLVNGIAKEQSMELRHLTQIDSISFDRDVIQAKSNAVVKLCSSWNGSSQLMGYALATFASQYQHIVRFFEIDIDDQPEIAEIYHIELVPTLLFFREGKLVDMLSGLSPRSIISSKIEYLISRN